MIESYAELKQRMAEFAEDDSAEVSAIIPTAIYLAEERLSRDLDLKTLYETTVVSSVTNVSIPGGGIESRINTGIQNTNFLEFNHVFQNGNKLDNVEYSFCKEVNQWESSVGTSARYYSFRDLPNILYIAPPVSSGTFEINYKRRPAKMSNGNQTNYLIDRAPDLLFYRSMIELSLAMKNWETLQFWQAQYDAALESTLNMGRKERTDIGQGNTGTNMTTHSTTGIN